MAEKCDDFKEGKKCPKCNKNVLYDSKSKDRHALNVVKVFGSIGLNCPHCDAEVFLGFKGGDYYCATAEYVNKISAESTELKDRLQTGI